jgi:hypothetical protein
LTSNNPHTLRWIDLSVNSISSIEVRHPPYTNGRIHAGLTRG